jgi:hypothetical protein
MFMSAFFHPNTRFVTWGDLHTSNLVGHELGEEDGGDAQSGVDAGHHEGVDGTQALYENSSVFGTEVLAGQLKEDVDADSDSCPLEIGCIRVSVPRSRTKSELHLLPLNMSIANEATRQR